MWWTLGAMGWGQLGAMGGLGGTQHWRAEMALVRLGGGGCIPGRAFGRSVRSAER